jgi:hypothetical protein
MQAWPMSLAGTSDYIVHEWLATRVLASARVVRPYSWPG